MRVVNVYFEKTERHRLTYKREKTESQVFDATYMQADTIENEPTSARKNTWWKLAEPDHSRWFTAEASSKLQ